MYPRSARRQRQAVEAAKANLGRPLAKPRKALVVESTCFSLKGWVSPRGNMASTVSERNSIRGPATTIIFFLIA